MIKFISSFELTISINSSTSFTSKAIKQKSDLSVEPLYLNLKTRLSKLARVYTFQTAIYLVNAIRLNGLKSSWETRQDDLKSNEVGFENSLKYTKKTYNMIVSLYKYKLGVKNEKEKNK